MPHNFSETLGRIMKHRDADVGNIILVVLSFIMSAVAAMFGGEYGPFACPIIFAFCLARLLAVAFQEQRQPPSRHGRVGMLSQSERQSARSRLLRLRVPCSSGLRKNAGLSPQAWI